MSSTICVDASFVVGLVTARTAFATLWSEWEGYNRQIVAPTLIYYEISNAFHRLNLANQISREQADQYIANATDLDIVLFGDAKLHQRAVILARQFNLPAAYDAHYLALSERLEAEFWTADRRLHNSIQETLEWVHLIQEG